MVNNQNMKPYPAYKPSGIPWLGDIPAHWEVWKISHAYRLIGSGTTPPSDNPEWYDGDVLWVTTSELREKVIFDTEKKVTNAALKQFSSLRIFPANSLLIAMYGATIGRVGLLGTEACTNQACCILAQSCVINYNFAFYCFQAIRDHIVSLSFGGGQPNINQEKIRSLKVAIPPSMNEQQAIAAYLDGETARLDALAARYRRLLALLDEKRRALITHAVTRGLNPAAPLKDSGIEWLGQIPAHWEVKRVKHLAWFNYGESLSFGVREIGDVPVYGSNGQVGTHSIANTHGPCLIIGRKGSFGKVNYSSAGCFAIDTTYYIDDTTTKCDIRWLFYCLSIIGMDKYSQDTGVPGLSRELAHNFWLPNLSLSEQQAIAEYLDRETARLDDLKAKIETLLARLGEYRAALISAAVTGKMDVTQTHQELA